MVSLHVWQVGAGSVVGSAVVGASVVVVGMNLVVVVFVVVVFVVVTTVVVLGVVVVPIVVVVVVVGIVVVVVVVPKVNVGCGVVVSRVRGGTICETHRGLNEKQKKRKEKTHRSSLDRAPSQHTNDRPKDQAKHQNGRDDKLEQLHSG